MRSPVIAFSLVAAAAAATISSTPNSPSFRLDGTFNPARRHLASQVSSLASRSLAELHGRDSQSKSEKNTKPRSAADHVKQHSAKNRTKAPMASSYGNSYAGIGPGSPTAVDADAANPGPGNGLPASIVIATNPADGTKSSSSNAVGGSAGGVNPVTNAISAPAGSGHGSTVINVGHAIVNVSEDDASADADATDDNPDSYLPSHSHSRRASDPDAHQLERSTNVHKLSHGIKLEDVERIPALGPT